MTVNDKTEAVCGRCRDIRTRNEIIREAELTKLRERNKELEARLHRRKLAFRYCNAKYQKDVNRLVEQNAELDKALTELGEERDRYHEELGLAKRQLEVLTSDKTAQRIADLVANEARPLLDQLAHKDKVIEVLAEWVLDGRLGGEQPVNVIIKEAEQKAGEV
jgi:predicted RNase H-like nuclease (RuvC/YqgF family)